MQQQQQLFKIMNPNVPQKETYFIIGFKKSTAFPAPETMIWVSQHVIEEHINEVNDRRDEYVKSYSKITSAFNASGTTANPLFLESDAQRKWKAPKRVPLVVTHLTEGTKTDPIYAICELPMFIWPDDVEQIDRFLYVEANDAIVIEPVLCEIEPYILAEAPDEIKTFGFKDKKLGVWRGYNKSDVAVDDTIRKFIVDYGLQEFAKLIKYEPIPQPEIQKRQNEIIERQIPSLSDIITEGFEVKPPTNKLLSKKHDEYESACKNHVLYPFARRMFASMIKAALRSNKKLGQDFEDDVYFEMFDALLRTGTSENAVLYMTQNDLQDAQDFK